MRLNDGMILYHGSYMAVEQIDLEKCSDGKDFGKGFYMTENEAQARKFIKTSLLKAKSAKQVPEEQNFGFVSAYRFHLSKERLNVCEFPETSKEWLWFISQNRRKKLAGDLMSLIAPELFEAEVIIGKIANDTTNPVLTTYLNGLYGKITSDRAINFAIEELMPYHLDDQFCFLSQNAVDCLEFVEAKKYVVG